MNKVSETTKKDGSYQYLCVELEDVMANPVFLMKIWQYLIK